MNFMNSVVNFFKDGGMFLYPLALIFVVGVSIAIERYVYLTRETIRNRSLWDSLGARLERRKLQTGGGPHPQLQGVDRHDSELRRRPRRERPAPRRHRKGHG